ncbi:MAG TPA: hypothetical protein VGN25_04615 [Solirubrobacteraceae bacterium]|jgi:hypothetical protein|nr:hypothetical protein [Solirubrobacteraceae bacterium]
MTLLLIAAAWLLTLVLVAGLCVTAGLADRDEARRRSEDTCSESPPQARGARRTSYPQSGHSIGRSRERNVAA